MVGKTILEREQAAWLVKSGICLAFFLFLEKTIVFATKNSALY